MDNKFKNNDIIYYQLDGGFIKHIKKWLQKRKESNKKSNSNISNSIDKYKKSPICKKNENTSTCKITDVQINSITYFLSHVLPTCKELNIQLQDIQDGIK